MNGLNVPWPWRLAHLAVLWAFAVVQPLLDLLGGHAEFFIARGNTSGDVLAFSIGLTVLPPLVLLGIEQLVGLASRRVAGYLHASLVALIAGAFAVQVFDRVFDFGGWVILAAGLAAGVVAAALYVRREEARSLLSVLSPAPLVFLALFLFFSDANKVVFPEDAEALGATSESSPLVVVVLDELTTTSLEDGRGRIDETRFPNFAALADEGTWYRNATTVADHTDEAIPALLTGQYPDIALDPISSDYPENLFTLFAGDRRLNVVEGSSRLCPESFCAADDGTFGERMDALASDLSVVTAHLLLPAKLTTGLPPVNDAFAGFGGGEEEGADDLRHVGIDDEEISSFLAGIDGEPRSLSYLHVLLPHGPWRYLPDGRDYQRGDVWREFDEDDDETWFADQEWVPKQGQRAHLLQTGFADSLLGDIVARMKEAGVYDESMLVVVADHGVGFTPGTSRRFIEDANAGEIAPVPLFIKEPGQAEGGTDPAPVRSIDVLPTIADVLDAEPPEGMDGEPASERSGLDGVIEVLRHDEPKAREFELADVLRGRDAAASRLAATFGTGWGDVYAMGPNAKLIGSDVRSLDVTEARPGTSFELSAARDYEDVDTSGGTIPALVYGELTDVTEGTPMAVAVNGEIAAVSEAYRSVGGYDAVALIAPPASFRDGPNEIELFEVEGGKRPLLRPVPGS